jgi:adenine-specific DNA methylase
LIPKECKRLAEVDFPIAAVSAHSAREKSIRHGHPSTLHLWWARRPLAACRAMLLALLLPDPCDENCPEQFKDDARNLLEKVQGKPGPKNLDLRKALLKFIGEFSNWDLTANQRYLEVGRGLIKAAHGEETPLIVDPFAGGGSIPLEALRLGCEVFASDLNPVACLILKVMLEDIPRHGHKLAEEIRRVGAEIKKHGEKELAQYYPADQDGATPIAYLWARTVKCESPNCGAEIPLIRSFWLCKKASRFRALRTKVLKSKDKTPKIDFEVFAPKSEKDVAAGTVARAKATCLACERVLAPDRVRAQLRQQRGGADAVFDANGSRIGGALLLAVVTLQDEKAGRQYRLPNDRDYAAIWKAHKALEKLAGEKLPSGVTVIPDESLPPQGTLGFRVQLYGMTRWSDLFTARQKIALATLAGQHRKTAADSAAIVLTLGKLADLSNSICSWEPVAECPRNVLAGGRIRPAWNFAEGVTTSEASGGFAICVDKPGERC